MSFRKDLNKVPAAACWDYEEIPLSVLVQACLREGERKRIARMPVADCGDYEAIPLSPKMPVGRLGHSRWASAARLVSSNPSKRVDKKSLALAKRRYLAFGNATAPWVPLLQRSRLYRSQSEPPT